MGLCAAALPASPALGTELWVLPSVSQGWGAQGGNPGREWHHFSFAAVCAALGKTLKEVAVERRVPWEISPSWSH